MGLRDELTDLLGSETYFGMDFGTSTCYMAYKEGDGAPRIPNYRDVSRGGIPSLFWRDKDGNEWVADQVAAKQGLESDPAGVCPSVKMKLAQKQILLNAMAYTPREIGIKLARRVLTLSRQALEQEMVEMEFDKLVCGVPVKFGAAKKGEVQYILQQATGCKNIRLVAEPILAALTNDFYTKKYRRESRRVLVVDMGGGTLDVVLLLPNPTPTPAEPYPYIAKCPMGLGGAYDADDDVAGVAKDAVAGDAQDAAMEKLIMEKVRQTPGTVDMRILEDENQFDRRRLRQIAKETKERLSSVDSCTVSISGLKCGSTIVTVTRSEYEDRIRPMFQKTVDLAAEVLKKCELERNPDIDILLVGGATYTPLLRQMLEERFFWLDEKQIMQRFPERAVALGAAIYAQMPELVRPRVAQGYAVNTHLADGKQEVLQVVIPSGANLPMTVTSNFQTRDANQWAVAFSVYEIDSGEEGEHIQIGSGRTTQFKIKHQFGGAVPRETPIRLTTTLTEDGVLNMKVEDFQADKKVTSETFNMNNTQSV